MAKKFCQECGMSLIETMNFCPKCGGANFSKNKPEPNYRSEVASTLTSQLPINQRSGSTKTSIGKSHKKSEPLLVADSIHRAKITNPQYLIYKASVANWLLIAFWAFLISAELSQLYILDQIRSLSAQYGFGQVPAQLIPTWGGASDIAVQLTSYAWVVGLLVCTMYCFYQLYIIMREYFGATMKYSMGWTIGSLFIPIVFLFRPWLGLGEIRRKIFEKQFNSSNSFDIFTLLFAILYFVSIVSMRIIAKEIDTLIKKTENSLTAAFFTEATNIIFLYSGLATLLTLVAFFYCRNSIVSIQKTIS